MQATWLFASRGTPRIAFLLWIASYLFVTTLSFTSLSVQHLPRSVSSCYRPSQQTIMRPIQKRLSSKRFGTQASERDEQMSTSETQTTTPVIAPWLALPLMGVGYQPHSETLLLQKLGQELSEYVTPDERQALFHAIHVAAFADDDGTRVDRTPLASCYLQTGLLQFMLLLVEIIEPDHVLLSAAAFHYVSCVKVAEWKLGNISPDSNSAEEPFDSNERAYFGALISSGILKDGTTSNGFGQEVVQIALDAAKLKSTECAASALVRRKTRGSSNNNSGRETKNAVDVLLPMATTSPRRSDAEHIRSLLLSLDNASGDWRALAIRAGAALYRLRGIDQLIQSTKSRSFSPYLYNPAIDDERIYKLQSSPGWNAAARDALYIYAPLAHRLGLHRLKSELEGCAFRILYPRQHRIATGLFQMTLREQLNVHCSFDKRGSDRSGGGGGGSAEDEIYERGIQKSLASHTEASDTMEQDSTKGKTLQYDESNRATASSLILANKLNVDINTVRDDDITILAGMHHVLTTVKDQLTHFLETDDYIREHMESVSITARVKEPYSLWRKMVRLNAEQVRAAQGSSSNSNSAIRIQGDTTTSGNSKDNNNGRTSGTISASKTSLTVLDVPDAMALRVILKSKPSYSPISSLSPTEQQAQADRDLCYRVQTIAFQNFPPCDNERIKDYIRHPKPNGYQTLQYSSNVHWMGVTWPIEFQMRSLDMHKVAEYGMAAHFDYKWDTTGTAKTKHKLTPTMDSRNVNVAADRKSTFYLNAGETKRERAPPRKPSSTDVIEGEVDPSSLKVSPKEDLEPVQPSINSTTTNVDAGIIDVGDNNTAVLTSHHVPKQQPPPQRPLSLMLTPNAIVPEQFATTEDPRIQQVALRRQLWKDHHTPYIEALATVRENLARHEVIVFLSTAGAATESPNNGDSGGGGNHGAIVSLPAGARVYDALKVGEWKLRMDFFLPSARAASASTNIRDATVDVDDGDISTTLITRNGVLAGLEDVLQSGDRLTVSYLAPKNGGGGGVVHESEDRLLSSQFLSTY